MNQRLRIPPISARLTTENAENFRLDSNGTILPGYPYVGYRMIFHFADKHEEAFPALRPLSYDGLYASLRRNFNAHRRSDWVPVINEALATSNLPLL